MKNKKLWVIIPARSGSKGIKNKNIKRLLNIPLFVHSIIFAKKLKFVDKIFFSSDSIKYCNLAKKHGAYVPFLRSSYASKSNSMEEDVLEDIRINLNKNNIIKPDYILWIRPTTPLRDINAFNRAYKIFLKKTNSICIVNRTESRIFLKRNKFLRPILKKFKKKSMLRRQECPEAFKIFYGEFFKFPRKYTKNFLGKKVRYIEQDTKCDFDIDYKHQFENLEIILKKNRRFYEKFLHTH